MKKGFIKLLFFVILLLLFCSFITVGYITRGQDGADNSFFDHFILAGGPVVWFLLLPMSVITIYLVFDLSVSIRRKRIVPIGVVNEISQLIKNNPMEKWLILVNKKTDLISFATMKIMTQTYVPRTEIDRLMLENIEQQALKLLRKIEWANIIGNVAPMIGLFGTVFGMIKAFNGIVIAGGQPQPAHLAEGISLALVTTFWGLLVAIPALAVAGIFKNRLETLTAQAMSDSESLIPVLRQSLKSEKDYIRKKANQKTAFESEPLETFEDSNV